jgi:hypothetical protein
MRSIGLTLLALLIQPVLGTRASRVIHEIQPPDEGDRDAHLVREVNQQLSRVPLYTVFDKLQYSVHGDEVTLTRRVFQPSVKYDAENAIRQIEGVKIVNNNIELLPPARWLTRLDVRGRGGLDPGRNYHATAWEIYDRDTSLLRAALAMNLVGDVF